MDNPHFVFRAYGGIKAHYFVWAVAHGAYDDIDPPTHRERWTQPALMPGVAPLHAPPAERRRLYRSRAPNVIDVPSWNRATLRVPVRHRLSAREVLRP